MYAQKIKSVNKETTYVILTRYRLGKRPITNPALQLEKTTTKLHSIIL